MAVELLAPCGDLERLKVAIEYGANAVYFGGKQFSLRARASNFTMEDIKSAVDYAHSKSAKAYVTVNMIPHNSDFEGLEDYLRTLGKFGVDAIICASRAILAVSKRVSPNMEVHISTQQTTTNSAAVAYWKSLGADRVVLAREVEYDDMVSIMKDVDTPIEIFIHGAMCANYSGRCVISNMLTNRDANRGGCAQSCRWSYHLYHNSDLIDRDDYLLSMGSKDMCAPDYVEKVLPLGVTSLKIEGRMKTAYYVATVVKAYRLLIDDFEANGSISEETMSYSKELLVRAANRATCAGFYPGLPDVNSQLYNNPSQASQTYVGSILDYKDGIATIEVRNYFKLHDELRVFNPKGNDVYFNVDYLVDLDGNEVEIANKPMQVLRMRVPVEVNTFSFITKKEVR